MGIPYKSQRTFQQRCEESRAIRQKYPHRYPFIIEKSTHAKSTVPEADKMKYLVPTDYTMGQFIALFRKNIKVPPETAIFFFCNNTLPTTGVLMSEIYNQYKDTDGFAYLQYTGESTFGYA